MLEEYKRKRSFSSTPEPADGVSDAPGFRFVVQKHRASHLHFDFRLELNGVLVSWAVPKGPSLDPADKRLAMHVEDHPISYFHFEGIIPAGNYGAGTVQVWDTGTWEPILDWDPVKKVALPPKKKRSKAEMEREAMALYQKGDFKFTLHGEKLKGGFVLAKMKRGRYGKDNEWLLIKKHDESAVAPYDANAPEHDWSVLSKRSLDEIAGDAGSAEWQSNRAAAPGKNDWVNAALKKRAAKASEKKSAGSSAPRGREKKTGAPKKSASKKSAKKESDAASLAGARKAEIPKSVRPMLATLVDEPPSQSSGDWLYEIKWDGYRAVAFVENSAVRLVSRNGNELTGDFPEMAELSSHLSVGRAVLDGEICALDEKGRPSFSLMQQRTGFEAMGKRGRQDRSLSIVYYLFDILYADGYDLTRVNLDERKKFLQSVLTTDERFRFSDSFPDGAALFAAAREQELEGIVAKRANSCYVQKRSGDWLKIKVTQRQECVIGGYTDPKGSRENFGSIVLGLYDGRARLIHVGQAGSGFTHKSHAALWKQLEKLATTKSPFANKVDANRRVHYVKPELVAEIKFVEWTHEGQNGGVKMRAPVFMGLRTDKSPEDCVFDFAQRTEQVVA